MGNSSGMEEKLPKIAASDNLTTKKPDLPSYVKEAVSSNRGPASPTMADAVDGEEGEELSPQAPKEADLPPPSCLTDGSNEQIPRDYILKWKVTDGNKEQRLKELVYTLNLLKSKDINELVTNPKKYDKDFYLLSKGMYRLHNQKYSNRQLLLQTLLNGDVLGFLKRYWKAILAEFDSKKSGADSSFNVGQLWEYYTETQSHIVDSLNNCYYILVVVWNGSDMKIPEILTILYEGIVEIVLHCLSTYLFPLMVNSTHPQHKVVKATLGIIHNFCNKHDAAISDLRGRNALAIIGTYRNSGTSTLKTKSILCCAYLLSEDDDKDKSVIELDLSDIKFLLTVLRDALDSPDEHSKKYGYHADELIVGLNNIASVDSNKKRLVDAGILPLYVEAMARKKPALLEGAAHGVWTLAFDKASMQRIKDEPGCVDALRKLTKSTSLEVKAAADGALWKLEGETKHLQMISAKQHQQASSGTGDKRKLLHIMISYQWDVKAEVLKFREILKNAGYRVWIDVEQMSGNALESMANAVENSALLVPVLTEKYKASPACRQEMSYANQLNKKIVPIRLQPKYRPDGWLGLVLGQTFFYDLTKAEEYESKIQGFLKAVGDAGKIRPGEDENPVTDDGTVVKTSSTLPTRSLVPSQPNTSMANDMPSPSIKTIFNVTKLDCVSWSKEQVGEWMKQNELEKYTKKFTGINGRLLAELAAVQFISPDAYYAMMKQEHGMSMIDILRLNAALRELNPASR